jgi:hypothetical protein
VLLFLFAACESTSADSSAVEETASESSALNACANVRCFAAPTCAPGQHVVTNASACCGKCVGDSKIPNDTCACYGGFMSAENCAIFGWPWDEKYELCLSPGIGTDGCAYVEKKHHGDGSGSDIYNIGVTCRYGE